MKLIMNEYGYGKIKITPNKSRLEQYAEDSLKGVLSNPTNVFDIKKIYQAFSNELRGLLEIEDLQKLIQKIFNIEGHLIQLDEISEFQNQDFPSLAEFYRNLAPTLLRAVWECSQQKIESPSLLSGWKEAIRISIEEEIVFIEEHL